MCRVQDSHSRGLTQSRASHASPLPAPSIVRWLAQKGTSAKMLRSARRGARPAFSPRRAGGRAGGSTQPDPGQLATGSGMGWRGAVRHAVVEAWGPDHSGRSSWASWHLTFTLCIRHCSFRPPVPMESPHQTHKRKGREPSPGELPAPPEVRGHSPPETTAGRWAACRAKSRLPTCQMPTQGNTAGRFLPKLDAPAKLEGRVPRGALARSTHKLPASGPQTLLDSTGRVAGSRSGPEILRHELPKPIGVGRGEDRFQVAPLSRKSTQ